MGVPTWCRLVIAGLNLIKRKKILIIEKEKKEWGKKIYLVPMWFDCGSHWQWWCRRQVWGCRLGAVSLIQEG